MTEDDRYRDEFGQPLPRWAPLAPGERGRHKSFDSAARAALDALLAVRDPFMEKLADMWSGLFPSLPLRPGRYEDGKIFLYVPNAPLMFAMRPRLKEIKARLAKLPGAPKKIDLRLEIRKAMRALAAAATLATAQIASAATFTRPMERVNSMDPIKAQSIYDSRAVGLVARPPLEIDYYARPYALAPGVCELPEVSPDGRTYTLKIADGAGLDAHDVARALERLRDPANVSPGAWTMKEVEEISVPSPDTLAIRLKKRLHVFPWMLAMSYCSVLDENGNGTGAYRLVRWRRNHDMVFERAPGARFPEGIVPFDTIRYLVVDDVSTQWLMFLKGEVDFLGEISRDNWDAVVSGDGELDPRLASEGVRLVAAPSLDVRYIGFNMRDPVVGGNKLLRQALTRAFDFSAWRNFYNGRIDPAYGPVPQSVDGYLDEPSPYSYDLNEAKRLLALAGYPDGVDSKTGRRLTLSMSIGRASQDSREAGELLASFFEKIGVKLELDFRIWGEFLSAVNEGRVQMYMMGWVGDYPDAENFLQLFHSKNTAPGPNHSCYSNELFDAEFDAAMNAPDAGSRIPHWKECQRIVREDCPWIFTHFPRSYSLVRPRVGNYIPSAFPYGSEKFYDCLDGRDERLPGASSTQPK